MIKDPNRNLWNRDGVIYLRFDMPERFGGKRISVSLRTGDYTVARRIRDQYIEPILTADSVMQAIERMAAYFGELKENTEAHISSLEDIINGGTSLTFQEAFDKYKAWLLKSGKRESTINKYINDITAAMEFFGSERLINDIDKTALAAYRDNMQARKRMPATIQNMFIELGGFFRWLDAEGLLSSRKPLEALTVKRPTVRVKNTPMIPHHLADKAMLCVPEWTLTPRIGRYSGLRLGEIVACAKKETKCNIVDKNGVLCFFVSKEFAKSHDDRYVPVADKIRPYVKDLTEVKQYTYLDNKKYNRRIKKIEGLEECKFHSWRVYANTSMMEAGIDENLRRRILGHKGGVHFGYTAASLEQMKKALDLIP